jgi:aubergine-like protein
VSRSDQPLLRCKLNDRIDKEIYLLPELCEMTGLTDEHRANFNLMKEMGQHLHKDARTVQNEVRSLIEEFSKQEKSARIMK